MTTLTQKVVEYPLGLAMPSNNSYNRMRILLGVETVQSQKKWIAIITGGRRLRAMKMLVEWAFKSTLLMKTN